MPYGSNKNLISFSTLEIYNIYDELNVLNIRANILHISSHKI